MGVLMKSAPLRVGTRPGLLRRGGIDDVHNSGNAVDRKTTLFGMLPDELLARRDVHAINLVARDVTLLPLHLRPQSTQHIAGFLRDRFEFLRRQCASSWKLAFNNELRHNPLPFMMVMAGSQVTPSTN